MRGILAVPRAWGAADARPVDTIDGFPRLILRAEGFALFVVATGGFALEASVMSLPARCCWSLLAARRRACRSVGAACKWPRAH